MITKDHIDAMEERCRRMFPFIDVTAVNMIMAEIQGLRSILTPSEVKAVEPKPEEVKIEEKITVKAAAVERKVSKVKKDEEVKEEPKTENAN